MHLSANLSMLFGDRPLVDRIAAAADAGFRSCEIQFPPPDATDRLARASAAARLPVTLINLPKGPDPAVGLACLPEARAAFAAAVAVCRDQALGLGVAKVNVLAGRPPPGTDPDACWRVLTDNLRRAGDAFGAIGVRVMVEPVNPVDVPGFFLDRLARGLAALEQAAHPNLFLQFDLYHMAITEPDLLAAIRLAGPRIGHVQVADTPGRHEPGSGRIDFPAALAGLAATGYQGAVAAEYRPAGATEAGLGWMDAFREWMGCVQADRWTGP